MWNLKIKFQPMQQSQFIRIQFQNSFQKNIKSLFKQNCLQFIVPKMNQLKLSVQKKHILKSKSKNKQIVSPPKNQKHQLTKASLMAEKKEEPTTKFETKTEIIQSTDSLVNRYKACMILSAVGDAMGYKNGDWQFNTSGKIIHQKMLQITNQKGIKQITINMQWKYSDDTVMHIATAQALINQLKNLKNLNKVSQQIAVQYKICATQMSGRAPGKTCMKSIQILEKDGSNWDQIPYNTRSCGCGGSMRSACIGLVYSDPKYLYDLIKVSIQAGRITHHNPIGYLGSMVSSFFTSLAMQGVPIRLWVRELFCTAFPLCEKYIKEADRQTKQNLTSKYWTTFQQYWLKYAGQRNLAVKQKQDNIPKFPKQYGVIQREHFYKFITFASWPGASGLDSVIIAYDALLGAETYEKDTDKWQQFCLRGILHGGDNDSTGAIGGAWYGAIHGFKGVPQKNYKQVQNNGKLKILGQRLLNVTLQ